MAITIKKKTAAPIEPVTIYQFGNGKAVGNSSMKDLLGGKGANLAEMSKLGIPVPPGFTIPCSVSVEYNKAQPHKSSGPIVEAVAVAVTQGLYALEAEFGYMPLVSVRSGARVSMPGMMDTILNVGITSKTLPMWVEMLGQRAALDSYRRLIQMYASVAIGLDSHLFDKALEEVKQSAGVTVDSELNEDHLNRVLFKYMKIVEEGCGEKFPDTLEEQVMGATLAVFDSWNNPRAIEYRKIHGYPHDWGTAVSIQSMVFGNMNNDSATGVVFTRNPSTGEKARSGEYLVNAQGEDVVAGIRTPEDFLGLYDWNSELYDEITEVLRVLEEHYKDMQDVEFTVQSGKLYILQTRNGKRAAKAAFKIAYDMALEGLVTKKEASERISKATVIAAMQDTIDPKFKVPANFSGIAAGGGVVTGVAVFSSANAINCTEPCILIRKETDPNDIAGMNKAVGILTATGGMTSHAAVVARGMNKTCVVGATAINMEGEQGFWYDDSGHYVLPGYQVTLDGATGRVWVGVDVPVIAGGETKEMKQVVSWGLVGEVPERISFSSDMGVDGMMGVLDSVVCGTIYVDTALLECPDAEGVSHDVTSMMGRLGASLGGFGGKIILDLDCLDTHIEPHDASLFTMFGEAPDRYSAMEKAHDIVKWGWVDCTNIVAITRDDTAAEYLRNMGVSVAGEVKTFADLINSNGPMRVSSGVVSAVFGSQEAYDLARELVEKSLGKKIEGTGEPPLYWFDFLTDKAA